MQRKHQRIQSSPNKALWYQANYKMNFFSVGYIVVVMRPTFNWVPTSCEPSLDNIFFLSKSYQLYIVSCLRMGFESTSLLSVSALSSMILGKPWACGQSVCEFIHVSSCCVWNVLFPCYHPSPLTLAFFPPHVLRAPWDMKGGFWGLCLI